jgi:hypothetical protein
MTSDLMRDGTGADQAGANSEAGRLAAEQLQHTLDRHKAARVIASVAEDSTEAQMLFAMLGLGIDEIRAAAQNRTVAA